VSLSSVLPDLSQRGGRHVLANMGVEGIRGDASHYSIQQFADLTYLSPEFESLSLSLSPPISGIAQRADITREA